jgi:hypothetical protein
MKRICIAFMVLLTLAACSPTGNAPTKQKINDAIVPSAIVATNGIDPVLENTTGPAPEPKVDPQQFAIDTMKYLVTFVYESTDCTNRSSYDAIADTYLAEKRGLCGERSIAMIMTMRRSNIPARIVGIFGLSYTLQGVSYSCYATHASVEVYYNGSWHFFDPTFGVYFTDSILSFTEVIEKAYTPQVLDGGYGTPDNKKLVLSFAQIHSGVVYGEDEYQEFTKYLAR